MGEKMYILGPCSAESREQMLLTAKQIEEWRLEMEDFQFIFRAGVWKPRTRPDSFQGAGDEALEWLQEVKRTYGVPVATEVATPEHVEKVLKAGIDYLWIGARTSANPIAVQAIAERLQVTGYGLRGVLIKNPVNADAGLWLGNIERLERTGVPVIAVHRGCGHKPCWSMAHQVRLARPDIPMLLDPSHMSGDATKVPELLQKLEELGLDGAMIEVHCCPEKALSDKKQQLRPKDLREIVGKELTKNQRITNEQLTGSSKEPRKEYGSEHGKEYGSEHGKEYGSEHSKELGRELNWLRAEIDELDEALWDTIAARMDVSRRIGEWKKEHGVAPLQPERYQQISGKLRVKSEELGLSQEFVEQVWNRIHEESLKQQD